MTWDAQDGMYYTIIIKNTGSQALGGVFVNIQGNNIMEENVRLPFLANSASFQFS